MPNKPTYRRRIPKRYLAGIKPLHRVPLETAHIGQYRLLVFRLVDCRCVVPVATEITALVRPTAPPFLFSTSIYVVPTHQSVFFGFGNIGVEKFRWVEFRADRDRRT